MSRWSVGRSDMTVGSHLRPPEVGVRSRLVEQFVVRAPLDDNARLHDEDLVDRLEAGQPMGDEDQRASHGHIQEVGRERIGGCRIEVLAWFVEHEHREVGQEGTGDDQPLALPPDTRIP